MKGHEYAQTSRAAKTVRLTYLFSAYSEYGGTGGSLIRPALEINLTPDPIADPLKSTDVLALWDAFLNHIRVQP